MEASKKCARKVADNMSFVGLHNTDEGIIGFADSKATIRFETGLVTEDTKRGHIKKIFKNNQFIFVTYGNNEIFSEEHKTNIEDYIQQNLKENMNYEEFFKRMNSDIQNDWADYNDGNYYFIIGSKNKNGKYFLVQCFIRQGERIQFSPKDYGKKALFGGDKFYCKVLEAQVSYYHLEINMYSSIIKKYIEALISAKDILQEIEYNTAGCPVNMEIFQ